MQIVGLVLFGAGAAAFMYLLLTFGVPRLLISLASQDSWWSPFRSLPPAGQYVILVKSSSEGPFDRIIHSVKDRKLDNDWNFVPGIEPHAENPNWYEKELGIVWVGFFKAYYRKPTLYSSFEKLSGSAKYDMVEKKRNVNLDDPYYFFQYSTMGAHIESAEIKDNISINMTVLFTARHLNPYKVHFLAGKWTVRATAAVERGTREYVRNKSIDDVREEQAKKAEGKPDNLVTTLKNLGTNAEIDPVPPGAEGNLTTEYGIEIDDPELISFELTPGDPELAAAMHKTAIAGKEKEAAVVQAEKKQIDAEAEAKRILTEYGAIASIPNGVGPQIALAHAIRESHPSTLVIGNLPVSVPIENK